MPPPALVLLADDPVLVGCRRGDPSAQRRLYELLAPRLLVVCRRYSHSDADAEDALQRAMFRILTRLDQWRGQGAFEAWARRVAVNVALDGWRSDELRPTVSWEAVAEPASAEPTPLERLSADDLLAVLDTLPPGYRMILNLYAIEGYAHAEIAALLGISEGTSRSQLARARTLLEKKLTVSSLRFLPHERA